MQIHASRDLGRIFNRNMPRNRQPARLPVANNRDHHQPRENQQIEDKFTRSQLFVLILGAELLGILLLPAIFPAANDLLMAIIQMLHSGAMEAVLLIREGGQGIAKMCTGFGMGLAELARSLGTVLLAATHQLWSVCSVQNFTVTLFLAYTFTNAPDLIKKFASVTEEAFTKTVPLPRRG